MTNVKQLLDKNLTSYKKKRITMAAFYVIFDSGLFLTRERELINCTIAVQSHLFGRYKVRYESLDRAKLNFFIKIIKTNFCDFIPSSSPRYISTTSHHLHPPSRFLRLIDMKYSESESEQFTVETKN